MVTNVKSNTSRPSDGSSVPSGDRPGLAFAKQRSGVLAARWGNWGPNRLVDRAGRHRRFAIACASLTLPFLVMGSAPAAAYHDKLFSTAHVLVGLSLLWLARDLIHHGSLVSGARNLPHMSIGSLAVGFTLLYRHRTEHFENLLEAQPSLGLGMTLFGAAVGVLSVDDRRHRPGQLGGLVGRLMLVLSASIVGIASIGGLLAGHLSPPAYWLGVGSAGIMLIGMAVFEGRLLWRAIALVDLSR